MSGGWTIEDRSTESSAVSVARHTSGDQIVMAEDGLHAFTPRVIPRDVIDELARIVDEQVTQRIDDRANRAPEES